MNLLPYDKFCIVSSLKPTEVQEQLQSEVGPTAGFSFINMFSRSDGKFFEGFAVKGNFEFKRGIQYRNSFLPMIKGHTEGWLNGSRVYVKMRLQPVVVVFMCVWLVAVGTAGIGVLTESIANNQFSPDVLIPLGMFTFGYALVMGSYTYERNKAKDKLLEMLAGQIDDITAYVEKKF